MKKGFCLVLFLFLLSLTLSSCVKKEYQSQGNVPGAIVPFYQTRPMDIVITPKSATIHVGMLLPLSGKSAKLGEDLRNAGVLAQFEVAGENFQLSFYDTKGTAEGAKAAFTQAKQENMQMILGPVFAYEVGAIRSMAQNSKIPVFSFTSDEDKLGKDVYSLALTIQNQTERIIRFACEKGAKHLAVMAPDNKAGDIAIDSAKKMADACGMEVVKLSVYNPTFINFEPYVLSVLPETVVKMRKDKLEEKKKARTKINKPEEALKQGNEAETLNEPQEAELTVAEQLDFDALFIADDGNRLKSISSLFGLYDVTPDDIFFLGLSTWNDKSLSNEGSLKHAYYPLLPTNGYNTFSKRFKETYGKSPNRLASLAYDAVALASALMNVQNLQTTTVQNPVGFLGTDGLFRFKEKGTVERLMGIYQIKGPNHFSRIELPSTSFEQEDLKKKNLEDIRILNTTYVEESTPKTEVEELTDSEAKDPLVLPQSNSNENQSGATQEPLLD